MISELIALRKKVVELEQSGTKIAHLEKEKVQLTNDVAYWKAEVQRALAWQDQCVIEQKRRAELKVVFDNTYKELKQTLKLVSHLRADRLTNERARQALQNKVRILEHEVEVWKRQKDFEHGLRLQAEARADDYERKFNDERAQRLQNLHKMNKEQVKVYISERLEREATLKTIETSKAASELSRIIKQLEATCESDRHILETQYRELQAQAAEVEALKSEAVLLRRVIQEKDARLVAHEYKMLELEKEMWRIQREAGQVMAAMEKASERDRLITMPSILTNHNWSASALSKTIHEHRREGKLLHKGLVTQRTEGNVDRMPDVVVGRAGPSSSSSSLSRPESPTTLIEAAAAATGAMTKAGSGTQQSQQLGSSQQTVGDSAAVSIDVSAGKKKAATSAPTAPAHKGSSTLKVNGSLFVGQGLSLRKPQDDYFAQFSGSPTQMVEKILTQNNIL